ncbi:hypothetical protein GCM10009734_94350 [Nonomuraea bangladeshensis]
MSLPITPEPVTVQTHRERTLTWRFAEGKLALMAKDDNISEVERVPPPEQKTCWMCGLPAICGEHVPGRDEIRGLCAAHAEAVFGPENPSWKQLDSIATRELFEEWLRGMTIVAHAKGRSSEEIMAEIAAVNRHSEISLKLTTPLPPGEMRQIGETIRALNLLRSREASVHMDITMTLVRWLAEATEQTPSEVIQQLALTIEAAPIEDL